MATPVGMKHRMNNNNLDARTSAFAPIVIAYGFETTPAPNNERKHMKRSVLFGSAILLTTTLAACTGTSKPECTRAQTVRDCNSNSGFSKPSPVVKSDLNKRHKAHKNPKPAVSAPQPKDPPAPPSGNIPAPESDNNTPPKTPDTPAPETPGTGDSGPNVPVQGTDVRPPTQSNSNDIKGFDPFGGLYGPGT